MSRIEQLFEPYGLTKLDIKRIYRYLDRTVKRDVVVLQEDDLD